MVNTVTPSILSSTKKNLGLSEDYTVFDSDIVMHINSIFSILNQLGIGPEEGFVIEDADALWTDFISDIRLSLVKSYIYLRVKLLFDPPPTSFVISAAQEQIKELEWRMNIYRETYTDPDDPLFTDTIDGGTPTA